MSKKTFAYCVRTEMCGGGTSYNVYFQTKDKPSHPLHDNHYYATTICFSGKEFFSVTDSIDPKSRWEMDCGLEKWESHKRLESRANRLAVRIAKRAFPELQGQRKLPSLWAPWTVPSQMVKIPVRLTLPA